MNLLKSLFGTPDFTSRADTTTDSPDPDPNDVWAFTDPDARDDYARDGKLRRLEQDIRFEAGDDIVFQCRMERDESKQERGPVLVARLRPTDRSVLCGNMSSAMKSMGGM